MLGRPKQARIDMSPFANRLHALLAKKNISDFERKNGLSKSTIQRIYGGAEPTRPTLEAIIRGTDCNPMWLIAGQGEMFSSSTLQENAKSPLPSASVGGSILPQLSQIALELMNELNDIHMRALEGLVTEEQFKAILLAATGSLADAARASGVEPKKAIG